MENWKDLFGSPTDCECKDCNSIFSPASYLVDIMQFLDNCPSNGAGSESVLQILFKRRPDIGNLLLNCENTNTEIPYIDLVNEIMEYYVAHSRDTTIPFKAADTGNATAEELKAEPQYILMDAYDAIYEQVYPFNLPYHQPLDVIRTYLNFLKTSRAELMEVFPSSIVPDGSTPPVFSYSSIPPAAIDAEWIQLSLREFEILTNYDFAGNYIIADPIESYYGNPSPYTGSGILVTDILQRTGLKYTDLLEILSTRFINPGQDVLNVLQTLVSKSSIQVQNIYDELYKRPGKDWDNITSDTFTTLLYPNNITRDVFRDWLNNINNGSTNLQKFQQVITLFEKTSECDIDKTILHSVQWVYESGDTLGFTADSTDPGDDLNINDSFLSKLHRFIRLWRKTGWEIHELDNLISSVDESDITVALIHKLSKINKVNAILNLSLPQLACFWGNLDTNGDNSLYAQLFLKNTGNITSKGIKQHSIFMPDILNKIFNVSPPPQLEKNLPEIFAALSISADDYQAIQANGKITNGDISLENLSLLYRYKLLADALNISIQDLCTIENLFHSAFGDFSAVTAATFGTGKSILITDTGTPLVTASVTKNSNQIDLTVGGASKIMNVNFVIGDNILIDEVKYSIASLPTGLGTSTISFSVDNTYVGDTNAALAASPVQYFQPDVSITLDFVQIILKLQNSGFSTADLNYILTGSARAIDNIALTSDQILQILPGLRNNLLKIDSDNPPSDIDIITTDLLSKKLMLVYTKEIADQFVLMLKSSVTQIIFVSVPDQSFSISSLPVASQAKYSYNVALSYRALTGMFQKNDTITDSNGSTAVIDKISDASVSLVLLNLSSTAPTAMVGIISSASSNVQANVDSYIEGATTTLNYSALVGQFKAGDNIVDSNGSTAVIVSITGNMLTLNNVKKITSPPLNMLGIIKSVAGANSAAVSSFKIIFQLNGTMTDEELSKIMSAPGVTPNFKTAVASLYDQSLAVLNQFCLIKAPVTDETVVIPSSLSPKYDYTQDPISQNYYLQCKGIMGDLEYSSLVTLGNSQFQNAIINIQNYPNSFLIDNFSGIYTNNVEINIALQKLFGIKGNSLANLFEKLKNFYGVFRPFFIAELKENQINASIGALVGLGPETFGSVIKSDMDILIGDAFKTGLTASYFNAGDLGDPVFATQPDLDLNFTWGATLPITKPQITSSSFSVRWTGWLCPTIDGNYYFTISGEDATDTVTLVIDGFEIISGGPSQSLVGGKMYPIVVEYQHTSGNAGVHLFWKSANMPQTIINTQFLYPDRISYPNNNVQPLLQRISLYHRAAQFITRFDLSNAEVNYFLNNQSSFDNINFLFLSRDQWLRVYDYNALKKTIPGNLLLSIFQLAANEDKINAGVFPTDNLISAIASANKPNWNKDYLFYLISYFKYVAKDFQNEVALLKIKKAMDLVIKTKMPVSNTGLPSWNEIETGLSTSVDTLHIIAEEIKNAVKAKYKDNWLTVATQLNNKIRENQKQALISYMLTLVLPSPDGMGNITDADGLFEYLLIDVQMTSVVVTSRLIQATLAVQLFADRCLLGLETEVKPDSITNKSPIDPDEWEWLKHYAVAAGLKKLFAFVENYLDPSLRDDKSQFFKDFESMIKKGDITDENVENAFREYLHRLNNASNMELCGMYNDTDAQTLYVFARTNDAAPNYYFRTATCGTKDNSWTWAAWEQVQLDIKGIDDGGNSGVHLMPIVWKKRLFLFWPEFIQKTLSSSNDSTDFYDFAKNESPSSQPHKYWEVRLAWSEYASGKWRSKKLTKKTLSNSFFTSIPINYFFQLKKLAKDALEITINECPSLSWITSYNSFEIREIHEEIEVSTFDIQDEESKYIFGNSFQKFTVYGAEIPGKLVAEYAHDVYVMKDGQLKLVKAGTPVQGEGPVYGGLYIASTSFLLEGTPTVLFSNNIKFNNFFNSSYNPFLFTDSDKHKTYFVAPDWWIYPIDKENTTVSNANIGELIKNKALIPLNIADKTIDSQLHFSKSTTELSATPALKIAPPINSLSNVLNEQNILPQFAAKKTTSYLASKNKNLQAFSGNEIAIPWKFSGLAFYTFYHPFTSILIKKLNQGGISALLAADTAEFAMDNAKGVVDEEPLRYANDQGTTFVENFSPVWQCVQQYNPNDRKRNYYLENVDFSQYGTYSCYNWELFFHAPFLIATTLSKNGKYAEAREWFHYIFNPLSTEKPFPGDAKHPKNDNSPFWQVLPFKDLSKNDDIDILQYISNLSVGYNNNDEIDSWRADPFNAFKIARSRPIIFMKNVVMRYLDNLINWGDDLFKTYIRENINEATQLYIMAAHILGPAPQYVPTRGTMQDYSYNNLKNIGLNDFGDVVVQMENAFPNSSEILLTDNSMPQNLLGIGKALYFCIPPNDQLLQYWTKVGDRLFKIRHGQNINGVFVPLALYEPPIDPALLLQAKAQGVDIAGILADLESPAPLYRFTYLLQKAKEYCIEVVSLGNSILSTKEKQDSEALSQLRQTQEIAMLNLVTDIKARAVLEAQANLDNLVTSRNTVAQKLSHYAEQLLGNQATQIPSIPQLSDDLDDTSSLPQETIIAPVTSSIDVSLAGTDESGVKIIPKEKQEMDYSDTAKWWQLAGNAGETLAGITTMFPELKILGAPLGVGTQTKVADGFSWGASISAAARAAIGAGSYYSALAGAASRMAGFIRREQDWVFQANSSARELIQIDKQITAAQIRLQMTKHELGNHNIQIQHAQDIETFLETKFTSQELYQWMLDKLQDVHKQGYQLAYDMARKAEKAYRFELGIQESTFIQYGYYNDSYLGISAGEQLQLALKQMDAAYIENNLREFELTKHISLVSLDPAALLQLIETGSCQFDLPEEWFDMDYPGHYFRRMKSVSISIPCVTGPYTTVNGTLRLQKNSIRINIISSDSKDYPRKNNNGVLADDPRFIENNIPFTAIATSSAQNDSGIFELNFRDERYLPFEGAGAISSWQLELNGKLLNKDDGTITDFSQFDYKTISDIIIHLKYTSREDAGEFRNNVIGNLITYKKAANFVRLFRVKRDFPNEFYAFINKPSPAGVQILDLSVDINRFPYFAASVGVKIKTVELIADSSVLTTLTLPNLANINLFNSDFGDLLYGKADYSSKPLKINQLQAQPLPITCKADEVATYDNLNELYILVHYHIE